MLAGRPSASSGSMSMSAPSPLQDAGRFAKCPLRIGIVSTGLMMRDSLEKQQLLGLRYGLIILDEAHKARTRQGFGRDAGKPNELLAFMREMAAARRSCPARHRHPYPDPFRGPLGPDGYPA